MAFQRFKDSFRSFDWTSLAPFFLVVGILGLILSAIFAFIRGEFSLTDPYVYVPLVVGVIGVLAFLLLDPTRIQIWLGSRQARYGLNTLIMVLALIGILVVVNYVASQETDKRKLWVDLTEGQSLSLAPETVRTLQTLSEPVETRAYFTAANTSWDTSLQLLNKFKAESGGKFSYVRIDPDADPISAKNDGVTRDGIIVMAVGSRTEIVNYASELEMTTAILRLENPGEHKVYFLTGHGEASITSTEDAGINQISETLQRKSYQVATLDLSKEKKVPAGTEALVIAGPKKPLLDFELKAVQDYLKQGGGLILMENPYPISGMDPEKDVLAKYLSKDWGITLQQDVIFDTISNYPLIAIASSLGDSTITQKLPQSYLLFPTAQSVALAQPAGKQLEQLALVLVGTAGPEAWGETDLKEIASFDLVENVVPTYDQDTDHAVPLIVAVTVSDSETGARIVVVGDEDFAENKFVGGYANSDLLINSLDWTAGQENLISLTPKETTTRYISIPPEKWAMNAIMFTSGCLLPLLPLLIGGIVWYYRRKHK